MMISWQGDLPGLVVSLRAARGFRKLYTYKRLGAGHRYIVPFVLAAIPRLTTVWPSSKFELTLVKRVPTTYVNSEGSDA